MPLQAIAGNTRPVVQAGEVLPVFYCLGDFPAYAAAIPRRYIFAPAPLDPPLVFNYLKKRGFPT